MVLDRLRLHRRAVAARNRLAQPGKNGVSYTLPEYLLGAMLRVTARELRAPLPPLPYEEEASARDFKSQQTPARAAEAEHLLRTHESLFAPLPDGYSAEGAVVRSGVHAGSLWVAGLPSSSASGIAVIGRQKLQAFFSL